MKAIVLHHYGPPNILTVREIPRPEPVGDEVLVKVQATAINDWDWAYVRGKPYIYRLIFGLLRPRVSVLGAEVAGTVEATGPQAKKFRRGDRVYGDISEAGFGGFAEYVSVREDALTHMPRSMTFEQAAALPHAALLAYQGLVGAGKIQRGDRVLINGAGGGVGTIGLQIAKQYDCEVTGVDRESKLDALRSLGFDQVIDYKQVDFTRNREGYDLILDAKSSRSIFRYPGALKPGGRYVSVGGSVPRLLELLFLGPVIGKMTGKRLKILALKPNQGLEEIHRLFESTSIKLLIDGPFGLEDVPAALERFGRSDHIGKIVIVTNASGEGRQ
ncbi:MAG: NAD(P)-dependent alcohol dehydrogenase [Spirochaetales bacterium]|nr:NAD(P)-dependent alcohol dehydrogenase [Spirochaetales bacterium]